MTLHTDLPIYKKGCELVALAFEVQRQMPRAFKRTLGEKITTHCTDMLNLMALANATRGPDRTGHIQALLACQHATTVHELPRRRRADPLHPYVGIAAGHRYTSTTMTPWLTDPEIDDLCDGLRANGAKVRHLEGLGLVVNRKPNGRPGLNHRVPLHPTTMPGKRQP